MTRDRLLWTLDGTGAELVRRGSQAKMLITEAQQMLDSIEKRVSKVLGVRGAPDRFDERTNDERDPVKLLITLACIGTELAGKLERFDIGDAHSIKCAGGGRHSRPAA